MARGNFLAVLVLLVPILMVGSATKLQDEYIRSFHGYKPKLTLDTAWLTINSTLHFDVVVYSLNDACWKCPFIEVATVPAQTTKTILVNTTYGTSVELRKPLVVYTPHSLCSLDKHFQEKGDYWLFIDDSPSNRSCDVILANNPMRAELPILFVAVGLVVLALIIEIMIRVYRKCTKSKSADITNPSSRSKHDIRVTHLRKMGNDVESVQVDDAPPSYDEEQKKPKKQRLRSLDTFRGISLVVMMFVNYGGGGYWFFDHPPWNGLTVADLVFPWFVFIMGTAMNFSFRGMIRRRKSKFQILIKIIRRSLILFGLGIILNTNWGPVDLRTIRIPGVLQRFSLTYLVAALMELVSARKEDSHQDRVWAPIRDVILYLHEWLIALSILGAYLALTLALPVPGCPTGYLGPGGLHEDGKYKNCTGGAAGYIDRLVLGDHHIYNNPTPKEIYQTTVPYDPEGILGILTSVFLCFLGIQSGRIIITYQGHVARVSRWLVWAVITGVIGAVLCKGSQNDGWIPLNKNLWSVSFILVTACFGFILLSGLYIIIDVFHVWHGAPFLFPGMNSIVVYCCHDIFYRFFPVNWTMENPEHWELLLKAVWDAAIWVVLAYIMYRKKLFVAL